MSFQQGKRKGRWGVGGGGMGSQQERTGREAEMRKQKLDVHLEKGGE